MIRNNERLLFMERISLSKYLLTYLRRAIIIRLTHLGRMIFKILGKMALTPSDWELCGLGLSRKRILTIRLIFNRCLILSIKQAKPVYILLSNFIKTYYLKLSVVMAFQFGWFNNSSFIKLFLSLWMTKFNWIRKEFLRKVIAVLRIGQNITLVTMLAKVSMIYTILTIN